MTALDDALAPVLAYLDAVAPGEPLGVYLFGSATAGGLRPSSDLDLLVVTRRSLEEGERIALTAMLLETSGRSPRLGPAAPRPLEFTSVVLADVRPWREQPRRDLQYGEWLRADIAAGRPLQPEDDPDVVVLLATALASGRTLRGPELVELVGEVPPSLLSEAMRATLPDILEEIVGDERNTLLVLARMLVTLRTGAIVPKDVAATAIAPDLDPEDRELLARARDGYLGLAADDWTGVAARVEALARRLAAEIDAA